MGYYTKDDYTLIRDRAGSTDGRLEVWSYDLKEWRTFPTIKRHLGQNVLVPISDKAAAALKKSDGGPMQPASAIGKGKKAKP